MTPAETCPPREFLADELRARHWTASDIAYRSELLTSEVFAILSGRKRIEWREAVHLGRALGTSPEYWLGLERAWRRGMT